MLFGCVFFYPFSYLIIERHSQFNIYMGIMYISAGGILSTLKELLIRRIICFYHSCIRLIIVIFVLDK